MGFTGRGGSGDIGYGMLSKASEKHRIPTAENIGYGKERTGDGLLSKGKARKVCCAGDIGHEGERTGHEGEISDAEGERNRTRKGTIG